MIAALWIMLLLIIASVIELFGVTRGWPSLVFLPAVFYSIMVFGWRLTVPMAVMGALVIDSVLGRPFFAATAVTGVSCLLVGAWKPYSATVGYWGQFIPYFILGTSYSLTVVVGEWWGGSSFEMVVRLGGPIILWTSVMMGLGGVLVVRLADAVAVRVDLPGLFVNQPWEAGV